MPTFTDDFNSLAGWTVESGSSFTGHFEIDASPPAGAPGAGGNAVKITNNANYWAGSRLDLIDGGDNTRTDFISFAFYIRDWNDMWMGGAGVGTQFFLPSLGYVGDPDQIGGNGVYILTLEPTSATTGIMYGSYSGTVSVSHQAWHTARLGGRIATGGVGEEYVYLDNALVTHTTGIGLPGFINAGEWGPGIYDDQQNYTDAVVWIDALTWMPAADPGDPITPVPDPDFPPGIHVYIDGTEVTGCTQTGSVTRTLNRPAQATARLYSECAIGNACSHMKVVIDGTLWFHGFVTQISTEAGEDGTLISEYTALDPMMLWQYRPARDGPASLDPGDFSKPDFFQEFLYGPQILEQLLLQSADDSDPALGEGTLFIDLPGATYATGVTDLSGAPTDWPMTIAEVFELMSSTGVLDAVLTPIDTGGNMASLAVYNGDYGTDRTATVAFEYETGDHNVKQVRMTEDSTNVCNKLWYYLGPRVGSATDPAGDQHWRANITGDDPGLPGYPASPPYSDVIDRRDDSRTACGVRMEVRIYDGQGDENPSTFRELYRRLWIMESWLRAVPRTLVHITPVRTSDFMLLPPGVNPVLPGDFDIGDLVTVTAGSIVRGGFTGAQRIYQYTITWDEDGIIELGELQTSADQEGIV